MTTRLNTFKKIINNKMDEEIEIPKYFSKNFMIAQEHIDFLDKINKNNSLALRTILNSIIRYTQYENRIKIIDKLLTRASMGFILILISYILNNTYLTTISICCGVFLVVYSIIGGFIDAVQLSKYKR